MRRTRLWAALVCLAALPAQTEPQPAPGDARALALIDEFHRVMPRDPGELRTAAVRAALAREALPV